MADYRAFVPAQRFQQTIALSPDGGTVAYSSNASGQFNLWTQPACGGAAVQQTRFTDQAVREIAWLPDGSGIAFAADAHGDEQYQIYLLRLGAGDAVRITGPGSQYWLAEYQAFPADGRCLLAAGNDRDPAVRDLLLYDMDGGNWQRFRGPEGTVLFPAGISPDGRWLLAGALGSNIDCQCYLASVADPSAQMVPVTRPLEGRYFYPGPWAADSSGFYVRAVMNGDRVGLGFCSLEHGSRGEPGTAVAVSVRELASPGWDVEEVVESRDGRTLVWAVNDNGRSVIRACRRVPGAAASAPLAVPALPDGVLRGMDISADGSRLALLMDSSVRPPEVIIASLGDDNDDDAVTYLTDIRPAGVRVTRPVAPEMVSFPAADGSSIPGLLYRPSAEGPLPVLMYVHGGPELQARPAYDALHQCLLASGIAVFAPNMRGSTGYGHSWQLRIYRDWGGIDLSDFADAAAYLRSLDWADPHRIAVFGSSYGGFAALSCLARLPDLWAAGVSICGPSSLNTLVSSVPPAWRSAMADMIGDPERDADMLRAHSPLTYAGQITAPLFIIQGARDPRVPKAESDQIVEKLRANGVEVRYDVYEDEGHGFTSRDNEIKALSDVTDFLVGHLGS